MVLPVVNTALELVAGHRVGALPESEEVEKGIGVAGVKRKIEFFFIEKISLDAYARDSTRAQRGAA